MAKRANKTNAPKIGDKMVHAQVDAWGVLRRVFDTTIVGETKTRWIDANGKQWHKKTLVAVNQGPLSAYLMTPEVFKRSTGS
jgi:hypothetical protein